MNNKPKKIAAVTATRAEFGLLSRLMKLLDQSANFELQLFVTGAHLIESQGKTIDEIVAQGFSITQQIPILADNQTETDLTAATAIALAEFGKAFKQHKPDAVVVLGDRYELLGICSAALLCHIPIVHLHGGEVTEGAMDEAIRHAITKMASLHFVAAEPYAKRVIQMGEQPNRVFNVGAPGLDIIQQLEPLSKVELEQFLDMSFTSPLFVVTYHPVTWGCTQGKQALENLFKALEQFENSTVVWTAANTDEAGVEINKLTQQWIEHTSLNATFVTSLGSLRYLSLLKYADAVIGNSSSGIIEAPAMQVATVNIGERQAGRLMAKSVIASSEAKVDIQLRVQQALEFKDWNNNSLYGQGNTAEKILEVLLSVDLPSLKCKSFYDLAY
jgi:UDP-hydrolysing UDP-N-acetyl-D-glucosamine 2-epimerase